MRTILEVAIVLTILAGFTAGQTKQSNAPKKAAAASAAEAKWKAIWEPVSFNRDIELNSIACTGPETCWVAGRKSTILFTADGGKTWTVQMGGDPAATDDDLAEITFLDAKHGWARTEGSRVMGTTDGSTWVELGKLPATSRALRFLTATTGLAADSHDSQTRSHLNRSEDGGKTWKRGQPCGLEATIDGLARQLGCSVRVIQFVSPTAGFMGGGAPASMGMSVGSFSRTTDGGANWTHSIIPGTKHAVDEIHFWSEKAGLVLMGSGQTYWTEDAGTTWTGSTNSPPWRSFYAAAEGKLVVGVGENGRQIGYSFNGGKSFSSRPSTLPAAVRDVAFPDTRHGYFVGQHGMVFRYRIVPADYTSPGMFAAAAAPQ